MKKWILGFLCVVFVFASLYPTLYELERKGDIPGNRSFELVHNYITDYNFYLSRIREGWDGRWTAVERYTSEPHQGSLLQEMYVLLGRLVRPVARPDVAVPAAYHAARIVFGFLLAGTVAWIVLSLFSSTFWAVIAFLLALTASGWPIFVTVGYVWRIGGYMPWWTVLDALQRITFLPHILLGQVMVAYLLMTSGSPERMKKYHLFASGGIALLLGFVFPPGIAFVLVAYGVMALLEWFFPGVKTKRSIPHWLSESVVPRIRISWIALVPLVYYSALFLDYPWKRLVEFDQLHPTVFSVFEYLKTLGPTFIVGMCGAAAVLKNRDVRWYPQVAWVLSAIGLVFLFTFLPIQHPLRYTEMAVFIPLGLLSAYACRLLVIEVKKRHWSPYIGITAFVIPFLLFLLGTATMYSSWLWQKDFVDQKVAAGWPEIAMDNYIVYPMTAFVDALTFISEQTDTSSVILTSGVAGNYIPARTGRTVYLGHDNTVKKEEKTVAVGQFFAGSMDAKDAYAWLKRERISYIFFGPEEKNIGGAPDLAHLYPYIRNVFTNDDVTIYQVQ